MNRALPTMLVVGVVSLALWPAVASAQASPDPRPNIVTVVTDDQTLSQFTPEIMPRTFEILERSAATQFRQFLVSTPVCCPSRATLLTGQYAHNHGAKSNVPGYPTLRNKRNVLPVWLRRSGYSTLHVGKFLNGFARSLPKATRKPPGWNEWRSLIRNKYLGYRYSINGRGFNGGYAPRNYVTTWINRQSDRMIKTYAAKDRPFYLQVDHYAPHAGSPDLSRRCTGRTASPAPRDSTAFNDLRLPQPPSFNEADVSDKPSYASQLPLLDQARIDSLTLAYRCAAASLLEVDRGFARLWRVLGNSGERDNTIVIFYSDNGYLYGEHRESLAKYVGFDETVRVPMAMIVPEGLLAATPPTEVTDPAINVDLAPTILDFAEAAPCKAPGVCRVLDGYSMRPLLDGSDAGRAATRPLAIEYESLRGRAARALPCEYHGVRLGNDFFSHHTSVALNAPFICSATDEYEHYDLEADPYQLDNIYPAVDDPALSERQGELAALTAELAECAGIEGRDPLPPSGQWCR